MGGRHEARPEQAMLQQSRDPLAVLDIGLPPRHRLARRPPAFPRSGLTPRPLRCSSSSQAVSPSVRALIAPEVLDSEPKVTPPSLVYTPSDLTSAEADRRARRLSQTRWSSS